MNEELVKSRCRRARKIPKNKHVVVNAAAQDVSPEDEHINFDPLLNTKVEIDDEEDVLKMIEEADKEEDVDYLEDMYNDSTSNETMDCKAENNDSDDEMPHSHYQNGKPSQPSGSKGSSRKRSRSSFNNPKSLLFSTYFQIVEELEESPYPRVDGPEAICKICKKIIKGSRQITSNFTRHLRVKHSDDYEEYVKAKTNETTKFILQEVFDKLVVRFIAEEILPISIVDSESLKKLITFANPKLSVTSRQTAVTMINSEYSSMVSHHQRLLKMNGNFCTTADIWTINHKSYLGYTIHWIDETFNRHSKALACKRFSGSQSVDRINDIILQIHAEYGLNTSNVHATITDNAANFIKSFKDFGIDGVQMSTEVDSNEDEGDEKLFFESIPYDVFNSRIPKYIRCATHSLNLVASSDYLNILKKNVKRFNYHQKIMRKCSCIWINANRPTTSEQIMSVLGCQLKYPVATLWNSLFDSIKDLLNHKFKINQLMQLFNEEVLTEFDFNYLQEYLDLLGPITEAIDFLQKNKEMVYGFLLPTLARTRTKYLAMIDDDTHKYKSEVATSLLKSIEKRFFKYFNLTEDVNDAIVASVLCPQAKTKWISTLNPKFSGTTINEIIRLVKETVARECGEVFTLQTVNDDDTVNFFDFEANLPSQRSVSGKRSEIEFRAYLADNSLSFTMLNKYGLVKSVFLKYNTPLPSSAAVERLFSFPDLIHSSRGESLSDSNFEKLLLLKANCCLK